MSTPKDPLAKFRGRTPEAGASPTRPLLPGGAEGYEAFRAVDRRQYRLAIRPANGGWERVTYSYLLRIVEDGGLGTQICLVYTFMVVIIKGRNLNAVADAIDAESCLFVQEYDSVRWQKPADASAPFIDSIEIHAERPADELAARGAAG